MSQELLERLITASGICVLLHRWIRSVASMLQILSSRSMCSICERDTKLSLSHSCMGSVWTGCCCYVQHHDNLIQRIHDYVIVQVSGTRLSDPTPWGNGTFGEALLAPTIIYVRRLLSLIEAVNVKVCAPLH